MLSGAWRLVLGALAYGARRWALAPGAWHRLTPPGPCASAQEPRRRTVASTVAVRPIPGRAAAVLVGLRLRARAPRLETCVCHHNARASSLHSTRASDEEPRPLRTASPAKVGTLTHVKERTSDARPAAQVVCRIAFPSPARPSRKTCVYVDLESLDAGMEQLPAAPGMEQLLSEQTLDTQRLIRWISFSPHLKKGEKMKKEEKSLLARARART